MFKSDFQYEMYLRKLNTSELQGICNSIDKNKFAERYRLAKLYLEEKKAKETDVSELLKGPVKSKKLYKRVSDKTNALVLILVVLLLFTASFIAGKKVLALTTAKTNNEIFKAGKEVSLLQAQMKIFFPDIHTIYTKKDLGKLDEKNALFALTDKNNNVFLITSVLNTPDLTLEKARNDLIENPDFIILHSDLDTNSFLVTYKQNKHYYLAKIIKAKTNFIKIKARILSLNDVLDTLKVLSFIKVS